MTTMKRMFTALLLAVVAVVSAQAVLKEGDLAQTLSVLRSELNATHHEQLQRVARFESMNNGYAKMIAQTMARCQQVELMLNSQKSNYVFDLTYACSEAMKLNDEVNGRMMPFEVFAQQYLDQVRQYVRLVKSLEDIPDYLLTTDQMRADRDSCVSLANAIALDMAVQRVHIENAQKRTDLISQKARQLNDQAMATIEEVRHSVFSSSGQSFFSQVPRYSYYWKQGLSEFHDKYRPADDTHSQWRGNLIVFLFFFILSYVVISAVLSTVVIRWLIPRRFVTEEFKKKRGSIIAAASATLFAIITMVISCMLHDHNFIILAARLVSEYAWLVAVLMISLIVHLNGDQVGRGIRLYTPMMVLGFIVFAYRITFMPNTLVNITFPIVILLCTLWQWVAMRRHMEEMPRSDKFFLWMSLVVMLVSAVMSWMGNTMFSVQVLIWWIMQLTIFVTIIVIYDLLHRYEENHIAKDADIRHTWFYDAIYKMVIPIGATVSVGAAIYWAAGVFDNTEWVASILTYKFVDIPDVIVVSLDRLLWLLAVGFMFNYLIYVVVNTYVVWKEVKTRSKNRAVSLSMNIIKYVGWGLFVYVAMVTLHVNRAGITLILTGLSTGIGFAMKDTLENLFYGLSLMSGRVKIGDVIECDGVRGRVTNINYQSTLVETIDGSVIAFLNSQLFAKNFKNMTRNHGYEMARLSVGVAYGSHVEQVRKLIIDRLSKLDCYDRKKGINVLFDNFGDSSVDLTVVIWVRVATSVLDQARVKEEIYNALNEAGIEIPFPQADVHVRADAVAAMLAGQ